MRRSVLLSALVSALTILAVSAPRSLAALSDCGQPTSTGTGPKTGDALATLKEAVGTTSPCAEDPCVCDVNGDGSISTSDALRILRVAVSQPVTSAKKKPRYTG